MLLNLFAFFLSCLTSIENSQRLSGVVLSTTTNEPLPFAHVAVLGSSYGTVTNSQGEFSILIPSKFKQDTLVVSYVGFQLFRESIATLDFTNKLTVRLKSSEVQLPEIVIESKEKSLIEQAIEAIPLNHDQNNMRIRAFWRAKLKNERQFLQLSETSFDMYRHGKNSNPKSDVQILKGRIARDSSEMQKIFNINVGIRPKGLFTSSFLADFHLFTKKSIKNHEYSISDVTTYQGRTVYVLSFNKKESAEDYGYMGTILLDMETLAFWKINYSYSDKNIVAPPLLEGSKFAGAILGLNKSTSEKYEMELSFQLVEEKWYISHSIFDGTFILRNDKRELAEKLDYHAEFLASEIAKKGYSLPAKENFANNHFLEMQIDYDDPEFWSQYNYIVPSEDFESSFLELKAKL